MDVWGFYGQQQEEEEEENFPAAEAELPGPRAGECGSIPGLAVPGTGGGNGLAALASSRSIPAEVLAST